MNTKILRSRKKSLVALIFIVIFLLPFFVNDQMVFLSATTNNTDDLEINAKRGSIEATNTTELAYWDDNYGTISDLFVVGNRMYIALGTEGFVVYDITDLNPQFLTSWDLYSCNLIYVEGDLIFVSNNTGFNVVDISDTANPEWVCNWTNPGGVFALAAHGNYVYLADNDEFKVVNITDRNNPVNYWNNGATISEMHYVNGYVYTADNMGFMVCYNVTNPFSMGYEDSLGLIGISNVYYSENFIYYATQFTARVGNATEKDNLAYISEFTFNDTSYDIGVINNQLFVNEGDKLEVFDWTNKANPSYKYEYTDTEITMTEFYIYGNYAFAYNAYAVEILDLSDPANIASVYFEIIDGFTSKIFLDGNYAFVADKTSLEILDITDPANPNKVGFYHNPDGGTVTDICVRNDYIYLLEADGGDSLIVILSIDDPANPVYQGNVTFTGQSFDLYVDDEYAYVAQAWNGLAIIDIYYPNYPQKSLQYNEHGLVWGVTMLEDNLILAAEEYMHVIDVANPYNPEQIGNYTRPSAHYWGVEILDQYAYFLCTEGFDIIDLTDLLEPVKVGQFFTYETPIDVEVDGKYVYLLDAVEGLSIYDAENIAHPRLLGHYDDTATHESLIARNGYIYLAEGGNGTRILLTDPQLSVRAPLDLISFVGGFVLFSVIGLILRKKRKK